MEQRRQKWRHPSFLSLPFLLLLPWLRENFRFLECVCVFMAEWFRLGGGFYFFYFLFLPNSNKALNAYHFISLFHHILSLTSCISLPFSPSCGRHSPLWWGPHLASFGSQVYFQLDVQNLVKLQLD